MLGAKQWLNTPRLRPEDVQGKVVLVNVWTYSCIYCLRTLPFLRAWAAKYKDRGLVVIGVHSPEFRFERDPENVRTALGFLGVGYPIAIDSDHGIWQALENNAWPTFYFIDAAGRIRERLEGEGSYEHSERLIQALLCRRRKLRISRRRPQRYAHALPDWLGIVAQSVGFDGPVDDRRRVSDV